MSDWGIVSIIVLCILIGFAVQILLCYAMFYAGNRSAADDTAIDFSQQSVVHKNTEGSPCESPSLSNENSNN
jgi:hypothetical protein